MRGEFVLVLVIVSIISYISVEESVKLALIANYDTV